MDPSTLPRACDKFVKNSSCSRRTRMDSQCEKVIILNKISLEFIHIAHKVRLMVRSDQAGVFCQSGICASKRKKAHPFR